ncbi:MAG TPA: SRPBCC family protein [Opitutaceae bacterium]
MNTASSNHNLLNGELTYDGDFARLFYQRRLPYPRERVWAALTDPEQVKKWLMATSVAIDGRPGGSLDTVAGPSQIRATGKILTWDPPRAYEYEWVVEPREELPKGENSFVRWELADVGGETVLTLEHRRLTRATGSGFAAGWHAFLDRLAALVDGRPLPDWIKRFTELQRDYPGWEK